MKTSPTQKPPPHPFYGEYDERGLDPWHKDAFPDEFKSVVPNQTSKRGEGWYLNDAYRNQIGFVLDGTEFEATPTAKEGE